MSQADVQLIATALARRQQRIQDAQRLQLDQQRVENEKEAQQKEIDLRHDQLDQEDVHFKASMKAAQAMRDLQTVQMKQDIAHHIQMGESVPGDQPSEESPPDQNGDTYVTHNIDAGNGQSFQVTLPSLATTNKRIAAQKTAEEQPGHDFRVAEEKQQNIDALQRMQVQEGFESKQQNDRLEAEKANRNSENANRIAVANIGQGITSTTPIGLSHILKQIDDGDMTEKQFNQQGFQKGEKSLIANEMAKQGIQFKSDAQQALPSLITQGLRGIDAIDNYNSLIRQHPLEARIGASSIGKQANAYRATADETIPSVAVALSGVKRFSSPELQKYTSGTLPSANIFTSDAASNTIKRNSLLHGLSDQFDALTSNLQPGDAAKLKQRSGLLNYHTLNADGSVYVPKGTATNPPAGVVPPPTFNTGKGMSIQYGSDGQPILQGQPGQQ